MHTSATPAALRAPFLPFSLLPSSRRKRIYGAEAFVCLLLLLSIPLSGKAQDSPAPSTPLVEQPAPAQPDLSALAAELAPQPEEEAQRIAAAEITYGYLSYNDALKAMPAYADAQAQIATLRASCQAELEHNQETFSKAYYEYIEGQQTFDEYILLKRQKELEQLLNDNQTFKTQALQLLAEKEEALMQPLHKQLADIINRIGLQRNYAFILNTDNNAYLYLNGAIGTDITADVVAAME